MANLFKESSVSASMPEGIVPLFFIQIVATLSFSVLYSTLVLYMKGRLGLSTVSSNSIMGVFVAFNYGLHLLGGYWGGRLFSNRSLFSIGMLAQVVGCLLLAQENQAMLYYGLAAFLTGAGLNVTCLNCMLTQRFEPEDTRRESAFLWNYAGMNLGFFIGFTMSGYFQLSENYHSLFLLSSLGNVIAILICLKFWSSLDDKKTLFSSKSKSEQIRSTLLGLGLVMLMPVLLSKLLHHAELSNQLVMGIGVLMLFTLLWIAFKQEEQAAREKIYALLALLIVANVFWVLSQLAPMGLTHFIDDNVLRQWGGFIIPPQWFQNINTVTIVIGGPLISLLFGLLRKRGIQVNVPTQFAIALVMAGLAFVILPIGIALANQAGFVNPLWVVLSYFLQSIGELLIGPIGYAMIGLLAPTSLQGLLMGMWMLNIGVGSTLASYSSNLMTEGQTSLSPLVTNEGYSNVFLALGLIALSVGILLYLFIPRLRNLMQEPGQNDIKKQKLAVV